MSDQSKVSFTAMVDGTEEHYKLLEPYEQHELAMVPERILGWLRAVDDHTGYQVTRLGHSPQAATRAFRAGEDEEMVVVCAHVHDVGDVLAPANHSEVVGAMVRPYVSDRTTRFSSTTACSRVCTGSSTSARTPMSATGGRTIRRSHWSSSNPWSDACSTRAESRSRTLGLGSPPGKDNGSTGAHRW